MLGNSLTRYRCSKSTWAGLCLSAVGRAAHRSWSSAGRQRGLVRALRSDAMSMVGGPTRHLLRLLAGSQRGDAASCHQVLRSVLRSLSGAAQTHVCRELVRVLVSIVRAIASRASIASLLPFAGGWSMEGSRRCGPAIDPQLGEPLLSVGRLRNGSECRRLYRGC
ncbi:hypothetical protein PF008_g3802 [Phytophthora fragariae]|uniref:Uncharacterized protein n=1 Tax=Phytophthora fragariae TaxID=53985 RepID=A0A6G0SDR5_9STRA|nr:hypothetical protein PF008_g3802 [Phytophthora fragariae]